MHMFRILLQDLESVSEILKIVKGFLSSNYTVFRPVVTSLLALCCKVYLNTCSLFFVVCIKCQLTITFSPPSFSVCEAVAGDKSERKTPSKGHS